MKIIDAHSHLGNNQYPHGGDLIEKTGIKPRKFDSMTLYENFHYRFYAYYNFMYKFLEPWKVRDMLIRVGTGTRENMRASMDEAGVSYTVCLPVSLNYVSFEDLAAAREKDPGIIPFTGVDHARNLDYNQVYATHVKAGAKGLKLHPILHYLSLADKKTFAIIEAFAPFDLPILFHSGVTYYYLGEEKKNQSPELGSIHYAETLIKSFPKVNFIAGHSGTFQVQEVIDLLGKYKNVWVDTSFQSTFYIRKLIQTFGPEKVLYGSDWPYGRRIPTMEAAKAACRGDKTLEKLIFQDNAARLLKIQL